MFVFLYTCIPLCFGLHKCSFMCAGFFFFTGCINYIVFVVSGKTGVLPAYKMVSGDGSSCHEPLKSTKVLLVTGARTRDQVIGLRRREFVILRQPHSLEFCDQTSSRGNTLLRKHFNCSPLDVVAIALSRCL